jgi:exonuclease III
MLLDLPKDCEWIFCGDLNIVEKMEDKTSACGHMLSNKEKFAWQKLKDVLNIKEPIHSQHGLKFSWDNFRHNSARVLVGLDKLSMTKGGNKCQKLKALQYFVRGDASKSNHQPISSVINIMEEKRS